MAENSAGQHTTHAHAALAAARRHRCIKVIACGMSMHVRQARAKRTNACARVVQEDKTAPACDPATDPAFEAGLLLTMLRIESHLLLFWLLPLAGRDAEGFASPSERPDLKVSRRDEVDGTRSNKLSLGMLSVRAGAASLAFSALYPSLTLFFFGGAFLNLSRPFCSISAKTTSVSFSSAI